MDVRLLYPKYGRETFNIQIFCQFYFNIFAVSEHLLIAKYSCTFFSSKKEPIRRDIVKPNIFDRVI